MATEFCPRCGTARTGSFRFCRSCGFDFDAAGDPAPATPSTHPPVVTPAPDPANMATTYLAFEKLRWQLAVWRIVAFVAGMAIWLALDLNFGSDYFALMLVLFFVFPVVSPYVGQLLFFSIRAGRR